MYFRADLFCFSTLSFAAGIVNPIEAKVRKGKGAVGAYGNERTQQSLQDFPVVDSDEEEEKVQCAHKCAFPFSMCKQMLNCRVIFFTLI